MCLSEKGIIITICCPWFQSEQDKSLCGSAIKKAFQESDRVFITWFENGKWVVSPDVVINVLKHLKKQVKTPLKIEFGTCFK